MNSQAHLPRKEATHPACFQAGNGVSITANSDAQRASAGSVFQIPLGERQQVYVKDIWLEHTHSPIDGRPSVVLTVWAPEMVGIAKDANNKPRHYSLEAVEKLFEKVWKEPIGVTYSTIAANGSVLKSETKPVTFDTQQLSSSRLQPYIDGRGQSGENLEFVISAPRGTPDTLLPSLKDVLATLVKGGILSTECGKLATEKVDKFGSVERIEQELATSSGRRIVVNQRDPFKDLQSPTRF